MDDFSEISKVLPGYQVIAEIYRSPKTVVYRAWQLAALSTTSTRQPVIIKTLQRDYPSARELLQFHNQYLIAKALDVPGVVRVFALEPYGNSYALIMEDFGGVSLRDYCQGRSLPIGEFLDIAIKLADILHDLYHHRVIHKDIKPANLLIHPQDKTIKLIDFSIASLLSKETETIKHPNILEGTLAYLAPEQTGRMNRGIDYRSDFYALGITLFELITGQLPFYSEDPIEFVHFHMARSAPLASDVRSDVPIAISHILAKLMAKNAEDRYQSAIGLKHDFSLCRDQFLQTGTITPFELATCDASDRFTIPEKLYGRDREVATLLAAFDRIHQGHAELLLLAGGAGIGKTAIVREVHKPIAKQHGYFIQGKFDQFQRNIPLSAFVQSLRDLMGQLLGESDHQLQVWRQRIELALGDCTQVLIDVIPELESILGPQPAAPDATGAAAQNRFRFLFQKFIQVFSRDDSPLTIFLDDLQWADAASLSLLELLITDSAMGSLLLLGAYRDHEVSRTHPLMLTLAAARESAAHIETIALQPLGIDSVDQLVMDTLRCSLALAQPLSQFMFQKTQGNPFFIAQYLRALHQDCLITFDAPLGCWHYDMAHLRQTMIDDDVVQFMASQLQKLPKDTQAILKFAACIGNQFDLKTLAIVAEQSEAAIATALWPALQAELIFPQSQAYKFYLGSDPQILDALSDHYDTANLHYKFIHDRIQQAAYSLIPDRHKQATHYRIGKLLLDRLSPELRAEKVFELANQLNYGIPQIDSPAERWELAELNLLAGQRARSAAAYQAARDYAATAIALLRETAWGDRYKTLLALHELGAESASLCGDFEAMEQWSSTVLAQALDPVDCVKTYEIQIQSYTARNQFARAIETGFTALDRFGVRFPESPTQLEISQAFQHTAAQWAGKSIADLEQLPPMTDARQAAIIRLILSINSPIYLTQPTLYPLLILLTINRCLQYGHIDCSAFCYASYGLLLAYALQDIETGYEFGQLALRMASHLSAKDIQARTYFAVSGFIAHGKIHLRETMPLMLESYKVALESGNLEIVGYASTQIILNAYCLGQNLKVLKADLDSYEQVLHKLNQLTTLNYTRISGYVFDALLGERDNSVNQETILDHPRDTQSNIDKFINTNDVIGIFYSGVNYAILNYILNDIQCAYNYANLARDRVAGSTGMFIAIVFYFYDSLVVLAYLLDQSNYLDPSERDRLLERVAQNQTKLQAWADHAPMNSLHKWQLVAAERCRLQDQKSEAIEYYDQAIAGAKAQGFLSDEALAHERAALFYLDWQKPKLAAMYLQDAYYCYSRWGAKSKTDLLEKTYPELLLPILQVAPPSSPSLGMLNTIAGMTSVTPSLSNVTANDSLDMAAFLQVSQAISSTTNLNDCLEVLARAMLTSSGSDRCILALSHDGQWHVQMIATDAECLLCDIPLNDAVDLPIKLIQYVKNTCETVVANHANLERSSWVDEYLEHHQPQSLLCLPLLKQNQIIGVLYLENQLTSGVFNRDRLLTINCLSTQAAIALDNARLYQTNQSTLENLQQVQLKLIQHEKMSTLGNLVAGVAHEINNPVGCIVGNVVAIQEAIDDLFQTIDHYQARLPNPDPELQDWIATVDLDYLREDLPDLIRAMQDGGDRIRAISRSLRMFSRTDTDRKQRFNLQEGIESTLLILRHRLKGTNHRPAIEVQKHYETLPDINCFPGQINQVFMNLLANAIDALDEASVGRDFQELLKNPNRITVTATVHDQSIQIAITDNGMGIPEAIKHQIFERLFTTKTVGKGTGLGLTIAHQIVVEKHGGSIAVESQLGEGTTFTITLPIHSPD